MPTVTPIDESKAIDRNNELREISITDLVESKLNPRRTWDENQLKELAASIADVGIIEPLRVRPHPDHKGRFEIVAGARRYRAAKLAKRELVPCVIGALNDEQVVDVMMLENLQRADLHPLDEASAVASYQTIGLTIERISSKLRRSVGWVRQRLALRSLSDHVAKALRSDDISLGVALEIARVVGAGPQKIVLDAVLREQKHSGRITPGTAQHIVNDCQPRLATAPFDVKRDGIGGIASCMKCPYRSGNQTDLQTDEPGDPMICGNAQCYKDKCEAQWVEAAGEALSNGDEILDDSEAKSIFAPESTYVQDADYVERKGDLMVAGRVLKVADLAKKTGAPTVWARDSRGGIHQLVRRSDIEPAVRESRSALKGDSKKSLPKIDRLDFKLASRAAVVARRIIGVSVLTRLQDRPDYELRKIIDLIARIAFLQSESYIGDDPHVAVCRERGLAEKPTVSDVLEFIKRKSTAEVATFAVQMLTMMDDILTAKGDGELNLCCGALGLDPEKLISNAEAELAAEKAPSTEPSPKTEKAGQRQRGKTTVNDTSTASGANKDE